MKRRPLIATPPSSRLSLGRRARNRRITVRRGPHPLRRVWHWVTRILGAALGLGCVGALGAAGFAGVHRVVQSERLRVRAVEVRHSDVPQHRRTDDSEVLAYAGTPVGAPILNLDLDAIAQRVRHHPWIRSAAVRRQLPDRVVIEVAEHNPSLLVSLAGELYVADDDGQIFKSFAPGDGLVLPVLTGLDREEATRTLERTTERVRNVLGLAHAIENHGAQLGILDELHWDNDLGWSVTVRHGRRQDRVRIHLGKTGLKRLNLALATLRLMGERQQTPVVIWADGVKNPDRVQVQVAGTMAVSGKRPGTKDPALAGRGSHGTEG